MNTEQKPAVKPRKPKAGKSLLELRPDLAAEWHTARNAPITPQQVSLGSNYVAAWLCNKCGHVWATKVLDRALDHGCPECLLSRLKNLKRGGL